MCGTHRFSSIRLGCTIRYNYGKINILERERDERKLSGSKIN